MRTDDIISTVQSEKTMRLAMEEVMLPLENKELFIHDQENNREEHLVLEH